LRGELIHMVLTTAPPRVRYATVPSPPQMSVLHLLPRRVVDGIFAKRFGLTAPKA
jgi:hypothetical protein